MSSQVDMTHLPESGAVQFSRGNWSFCWRLYWHTVGGTWKAFGLSRELFCHAIQRPLGAAAILGFFFLDNLLVPGFRRVPVEKPVFLIGHPRSGTTFVHRLLTQTDEFAVFRLWEVMCPSLSLRVLLWPIVNWIIKSGRGTFFPKESGHLGALDEVEEEEILFFHTGNTQFSSCLAPMAFSDWDFTELVLADDQAPAIQRFNMRYFRGCLQRQLYTMGKSRAVTKMNYSAMRTKALFAEFPDAKFVYIARSPLETIPSHLTLHRNFFNHLWGLKRIPQPLLQRYYDRRYRHNVTFYRYLEELIASRAVPSDQLLVVNYDDLRENLEPTMNRVIEFAGLECSEKLRESIREQARSQAKYVRAHKNSDLSEFGLTEEKIVADLKPVFDKYGFRTSTAAPHTAPAEASDTDATAENRMPTLSGK